MAYKIYTSGNYFYIVGTTTNREYSGLAKDVIITRGTTNQTNFYITGVQNWKHKTILPIADIQDETGTPYADAAAFITFYEDNTGKSSPEATGINDVIAGNEIAIDKTDPDNPVISTDIETSSQVENPFENGSGDLAAITNNTGFKIVNNGLTLYVCDRGTGDVLQYPLSTAYDITTMGAQEDSFDFTGTDGAIVGIDVSPDGTKMLLYGLITKKIYEFTLTPNVISSASLVDEFLINQANGRGVTWKDKKVYVCVKNSSNIQVVTTTNDYDLTGAVLTTYNAIAWLDDIYDIEFNSDGEYLHLQSEVGGMVEVDLTTAYDVEGGGSLTGFTMLLTDNWSVTGFQLSADDTRFFIQSNTLEKIYQIDRYRTVTTSDVFNHATADGYSYVSRNGDWERHFALRSVTVGTKKIEAVVDTTSTTILSMRPYLSADFPEVTTTKTWFWLWSTDHDAGDGGIWWGQSDDLDFTNFVESGKIIDLYQAETPWLVRNPDHTDKLFLYYHTNATDPSNVAGMQETHLMTAPSGTLHGASWTQRGKPLGNEVGENHTGYAIVYRNGTGDWEAFHLIIGGKVTFTTAKSTSSDGLTFTRGDSFDDETFMADGRKSMLASVPIVINGENFSIVKHVKALDFTDGKMYLAAVGDDGFPSVYMGDLTSFDFTDLNYYQVDDTLHLYFALDNTDIYHSTFLLSELMHFKAEDLERQLDTYYGDTFWREQQITYQVKVSLTATNVNNIGSTPIDAVAIPSAGKVLNVLSAFAVLTYGSVAFDNNSLYISIDTGGNLMELTSFLDSVATNTKRAAFVASADDDLVTNKKIVISGTDSVATGDSPVDVYITYEIITL
jgi:hypothetical protein